MSPHVIMPSRLSLGCKTAFIAEKIPVKGGVSMLGSYSVGVITSRKAYNDRHLRTGTATDCLHVEPSKWLYVGPNMWYGGSPLHSWAVGIYLHTWPGSSITHATSSRGNHLHVGGARCMHAWPGT
jgi:hypothetical protein